MEKDGTIMKKADILIRNGCVVDPFRDIQAVGTIAIAGGQIVDAAEYTGGEQEVDASGCYVCLPQNYCPKHGP